MATISKPTNAELTAAFTEWFNNLVARQSAPFAQPASPNVVAAPELTFDQIKELFSTGSTPATHLIYRAVLSQTAGDAPVATVLENTVGNIVWTRSQAGTYVATLAAAFPQNKVCALIQGSNDVTQTQAISIHRTTANTLTVLTTDDVSTGAAIDDILSETFVQILVYP